MTFNFFHDIKVTNFTSGVSDKIRDYTDEELKTLYVDSVRIVEDELSKLKAAVTPESAVNSFTTIIHEAIHTLDTFGVDVYSAWDRVHESKTMTGVPADHTGITGFLGRVVGKVEEFFGYHRAGFNMPTLEVPEPVEPTPVVEPVIAAPAEPVQANVEVSATVVANVAETPSAASPEPAKAIPDVSVVVK